MPKPHVEIKCGVADGAVGGVIGEECGGGGELGGVVVGRGEDFAAVVAWGGIG